MGELEIITLVDNCVVHPRQSVRGLLGEHGLSFHLTAGGRKILFDLGRGSTLNHNFKLIDLNWSAIDSIILSHGHSDHTGGLEEVLSKTEGVNVFVHPDIFIPKYTIKGDADPQPAKGLLCSKIEYETLGANFILREEKLQIDEDLYIVGPIKRIKPSDDRNMVNRYIKGADGFIADPFKEEQLLVLNTTDGLFLVLGCTHNGLENTIEQVQEIMGEERISGIIGGLHLCDTNQDKLEELTKWLQKLQLKQLICGHCTGFSAAAILRAHLGVKVTLNHVGYRISLNLLHA